MRVTKKLAVLVIAILMVLAIIPPATAQEGATFTYALNGNPVQLDPSVVTDGISFNVLRQGCEALLNFAGETTIPEPSLAHSWDVSEDGLTWTFNLQEGVTFHDGTPFNAEAVVFNFERWINTDNPYHFAEQAFEYYSAQFGGFDDSSIISGVEATGEYEVTFTMTNPLPAMLNNLAMVQFGISSPAAIMEHGANYGTPEVGYSCTGPFTFVEWISDDRVVVERNADYWNEFPGNIDRVVFRVIPDKAAALAAMQAGEVDMFDSPNVEDLDTIANSDDLQLLARPGFNVLYLAFNYRIQEFRDPLVREAISLAVDRQLIVDAFYPEGAVAANTFHPPSIASGFNPGIETPYDPARAMELLAEAGYPDGLSEVNVLGVDEDGNVTDEVVETIPIRMYFQPVVRPYNPDGEGIGEATVAMLAEAGIISELSSAGDWATFLDERANGNLIGIYQLGWTGDNGDPDNFIGYFFADSASPLAREGFYQNEALGTLLTQARFENDTALRDQLYKDAESLVAETSDRVFVAHGPVPIAASARVQNYIVNPLNNELFKFVTLGE
jgi:peptide/nickel transport system substrate-binding protein